jgi:alkylation response protein AidB-like acyl-CoA dehydrogenase
MITVEQDEHVELRAALRRLVERESTIDKVVAHAALPSGYDPDWWRRTASAIGVAGLTVPERWGGAGASIVEQVVAGIEFGRVLACSPTVATVGLAVPTLVASGHEPAQQEWLPKIASGEVTAAVVYRSPNGGVADGRSTVTTSSSPSGWTLSGEARFVLDGQSADLLLVYARAGERGLSLFSVRGDAAGLRRRRMDSLDGTRSLAEVTFDGVEAELLAEGAVAAAALERAIDVAAVVLAAEQQGAAERVLEMAVEYAGGRFQFGRSIASFQAIKHRCADLAVDLDRGRSALLHAAWAASEPGADRHLGSAAATAALVCGRVFDRVAVENVQIHGGIGFTWEHSAHLYFRRAKSDVALLANDDYYIDRLLAVVAG